jgi:hypothetical protein
MRPSIPLLLGIVLVMAPAAAMAQAQSVAAPSAPAQPAASQQVAARPAAAAATAASAPEPKPAHRAQHSHKPRTPSARRTAASLALGATDITGNKELPKVMVIVPWKDSLGAGGVIKPTDSLMDDVLQPVDRGVFQRQIRYYGQLGAAAEPAAASGVAPVGDSH